MNQRFLDRLLKKPGSLHDTRKATTIFSTRSEGIL